MKWKAYQNYVMRYPKTSYDFRLLHQLTSMYHQQLKKNLSIPYFLLQTLREMSAKVQRGKKEALTNHGILKLIISDALERHFPKVSWEEFIAMSDEEFSAIEEEAREVIHVKDSSKKQKKKRKKEHLERKRLKRGEKWRRQTRKCQPP